MTVDAPFASFPDLATERLRLREIQPSDAAALFEFLSDPRVTRYYGHEPHRTIDDTRRLIERIAAHYQRREAIRWGIALSGDPTLIGSCNFHHLEAASHRAEVGYELHPAHWGKGIMTEALSAILTYGFETLGLHRVEAIIDIENAASKALLLKLGFQYEGNLRQRFLYQGQFVDEHYFGLLRHEWLASAWMTGRLSGRG